MLGAVLDPDLRARQVRRQRGKFAPDALLLLDGVRADVHAHSRGGRNRVRGRTGLQHGRRDRRARIGVAQLGDREYLMGNLDGCVDALVRIEAGMRGASEHMHRVLADALAGNLQCAVRTAFEDQRGTCLTGAALDDRP